MDFFAKITTVWHGDMGDEWKAERDNILATLVASGKTDGVLINDFPDENGNLIFHRFFTDRAAAQEFVDWWSSTAAVNEAMISIIDL